MTSSLVIITAVSSDMLLFVGGFYTGLWVQRHSREIIEREVPKIIEIEKVVKVEVPHLIQVPNMQAPKNGGSLPVMGTQRNTIIDPAKKREVETMESLLGQTPEV